VFRDWWLRVSRRNDPGLVVGTYVFGDFCSGEIWGYWNGEKQILQSTDLQISSFGEDRDGELYVLGYGGTIVRIVPKAVDHAP
jgi:hypothetical protein